MILADLCVHAGLHSPTIDAHVCLCQRQRVPSCHMDHLPHYINASNAFSDRVLHLATVAVDTKYMTKCQYSDMHPLAAHAHL